MRSLVLRSVGAAALSALMTLSAVAQSGAALLPENTLLYFGSDDIQAFLAESGTKPLGRIMKEDEVQEFIRKPMEMVGMAMEQGLAAARQAPGLENVEISADRLWAGPYGRAFFAFTHLTIPEGGMKMDPDVGLVVGLEARQGAVDLLDLLKQVVFTMAGGEAEAATVQVGSLSYMRARTPDGDGPPICFAKVGNLSLLSLSELSMKQILTTAASGQGSLESSNDYQRCVASCGAPTNGSPVVYMHMGRTMDMVSSILDRAASEVQGEEASILALVRGLLDVSGLRGCGPMYASSAWEGDVAVSRTYFEIDPQVRGLMQALTQQIPVDRNLLKVVPKDALSFSIAAFDLAPIYDALVGTLEQNAPEIHAMMMSEMNGWLAQVSGTDADGNPMFDLRRDLLGAIGGQAFSMSMPGAPTMFGPGGDFVGWMGSKDDARLAKSLEFIVSLPSQFGLPITFKEQDVDGVKVKSLDPMSLGQMAMMTGGMEPAYAIHEGRLYYGSSPGAIGKLLQGLANPPEFNITHKEDFAQHWNKVDPQAELYTLAYSDTATNFENGYGTIMQLVPLLGMTGGFDMEQLPIDLAMLPSAEAISQHLFGTVTVAMKQGNSFVTEARGPFGAEAGLVAAGLGMGVMAGFTMMQTTVGGPVYEEFPAIEVMEMTPADVARRDMDDLAAAVTVYVVEFGDPPATLADLVKPMANYEKGVLLRSELPVDPWGNGYQYKAPANGAGLIWSLGPNGVDEQGKGDDIAREL